MSPAAALDVICLQRVRIGWNGEDRSVYFLGVFITLLPPPLNPRKKVAKTRPNKRKKDGIDFRSTQNQKKRQTPKKSKSKKKDPSSRMGTALSTKSSSSASRQHKKIHDRNEAVPELGVGRLCKAFWGKVECGEMICRLFLIKARSRFPSTICCAAVDPLTAYCDGMGIEAEGGEKICVLFGVEEQASYRLVQMHRRCCAAPQSIFQNRIEGEKEKKEETQQKKSLGQETRREDEERELIKKFQGLVTCREKQNAFRGLDTLLQSRDIITIVAAYALTENGMWPEANNLCICPTLVCKRYLVHEWEREAKLRLMASQLTAFSMLHEAPLMRAYAHYNIAHIAQKLNHHEPPPLWCSLLLSHIHKEREPEP
jgi:hypothetical protein